MEQLNWKEQSILYSTLFSLGNVIPLDLRIDVEQCRSELKHWDSSWQKYNPRDGGVARFGLPYTSLDGEVIEPVGLDSLRQYNAENNTNYSELDFTKFTKVADEMHSCKELRTFFDKHMNRSHFLRLGKGGFFPPHRDGISFGNFRVIVPITMNTGKFLIEDVPINFTNGTVYLVNTIREHCLFSFSNYMTMLVLNIDTNEEIIRKCMRRTKSK